MHTNAQNGCESADVAPVLVLRRDLASTVAITGQPLICTEVAIMYRWV